MHQTTKHQPSNGHSFMFSPQIIRTDIIPFWFFPSQFALILFVFSHFHQMQNEKCRWHFCFIVAHLIAVHSWTVFFIPLSPHRIQIYGRDLGKAIAKRHEKYPRFKWKQMYLYHSFPVVFCFQVGFSNRNTANALQLTPMWIKWMSNACSQDAFI